MEEREVQTVPDAGLLGADRDIFAQVWSRVSPGEGSVIEPVAPLAPPVEPAPTPEAPVPQPSPAAVERQELSAEEVQSRQLQALVLGCLTDGSVYRDLAKRTHRSVNELQELYRQKLRQAKRLSAAYFLLTGVRYWPREATPVNPPEGFFPALRERYLAEGRLGKRLDELAEACGEASLQELYADLAQDTHAMVRSIRAIVERET